MIINVEMALTCDDLQASPLAYKRLHVLRKATHYQCVFLVVEAITQRFQCFHYRRQFRRQCDPLHLPRLHLTAHFSRIKKIKLVQYIECSKSITWFRHAINVGRSPFSAASKMRLSCGFSISYVFIWTAGGSAFASVWLRERGRWCRWTFGMVLLEAFALLVLVVVTPPPLPPTVRAVADTGERCLPPCNECDVAAFVADDVLANILCDEPMRWNSLASLLGESLCDCERFNRYS